MLNILNFELQINQHYLPLTSSKYFHNLTLLNIISMDTNVFKNTSSWELHLKIIFREHCIKNKSYSRILHSVKSYV